MPMWSLGKPSPEGTFQVTLQETGEIYPCRLGQSLLAAMVALGRRGIPSGCHGGGCGVCKVRILDGRVEIGPMSRAHVSEQMQTAGYALACRTYPLSPVTLEVVGGFRKAIARDRE